MDGNDSKEANVLVYIIQSDHHLMIQGERQAVYRAEKDELVSYSIETDDCLIVGGTVCLDHLVDVIVDVGFYPDSRSGGDWWLWDEGIGEFPHEWEGPLRGRYGAWHGEPYAKLLVRSLASLSGNDLDLEDSD